MIDTIGDEDKVEIEGRLRKIREALQDFKEETREDEELKLQGTINRELGLVVDKIAEVTEQNLIVVNRLNQEDK